MKEKILLIIIVSICFLPGCIKNNNDIKYARSEDLQLIIEMDHYIFSNIEAITMLASIVNIKDKPLLISTTLSFHSNLYGELITPSNISYSMSTRASIDPIKEDILLKPHKNLTITIPMTELICYNDYESEYNWSEYGNHSIIFWYNSVQPYVYSNIITFNLIMQS